jgi:hypothetical protein
MPETNADQELTAIQQIIAALNPLDVEGRSRVISYVFQRLGISLSSVSWEGAACVASAAPPVGPTVALHQAVQRQADIRSFAQEKSPRSANEMAAVVAYYLSELAPADDRKSDVSADDIEKYFKQANFPLPAAARMTLTNAKNAGYLDAGTERGTYRLNAVGHNLVAHGLPAGDGSGQNTRVRAKRGRGRHQSKRQGKRR